jgi:hypothetical protein
MTQLQTECSQGEQINAFLANRLDSEGRQAFLGHLGVCEECAALLRDLREDERLARIPLTAKEQDRIRRIVREARQQVAARLETERRERPAEPPAAPAVPLAVPRLAVLPPSLRRVLWLSAAAAAALATAMWLLWR